MARILNKLTAKTVNALREPGRYSDGDRLYLQISQAGRKQWTFFYHFNGKQREMGLGRAGPSGVSLADARAAAEKARNLVRDGLDPIEQRRSKELARAAAETNFGTFADDYVKVRRTGWSNKKHAAQWEMTLSNAYCSEIRSKPISQISVDHVLNVLEPIWQSKPETARRIRMRIEKVLDAAKVRGLRTGENPAHWKGQLDHLLPGHGKTTKTHHAAMPMEKVPEFYQALMSRAGPAALALRFLILTACRTGEVLKANWSELDLEKRLWTIPSERMKSRRPHVVPLTEQMLDLLSKCQCLNVENETNIANLVFRIPEKSGPLSDMALLMLLRRMKVTDATAHGFRSSFRDWVSEKTNFSGDVAEMALAHSVGNATEAAYRRGNLLEKRRELMQAWSLFVAPS